VRTPIGRRGGALAGVHPADLSAHVLKTVLGRSGVDPEAVDDVFCGCAIQAAAAARQAGVAVVQLQRHRLQLNRAALVQTHQEQQAEVVAQRRVDRVVVDEVPRSYRTVPATPWKRWAEWPATSVAPASSSAGAARRTCGTGSVVMFGPQCGVTSTASARAASSRTVSVSQAGTPSRSRPRATPGRSG
jgi:hypothetical protein